MMYKWVKRIVVVLMFLIMLGPLTVQAQNKVNLYLFHSLSCPHCKAEKAYLKTIENKYPNLKIYMYEVSKDANNQKLLIKAGEILKKTVKEGNFISIPFTIIGNDSFVGFDDVQSPKYIEDAIKYYSEHSYRDKVGEMLGVVEKSANNNGDDKRPDNNSKTIHIPLLGEINPKTISLPIVTAVVGFIDGFNPCSLWVLLFMMSVLLSMNDKKKLFYVGLAFILTSSIVYFLFMASWLNFTMFIGSIIGIRYFIALIAVGGGLINIKSALKNKDGGCEVVDDKKRNKLFDKIKYFTKQNSLIIAILGTMTVALSVNLIDMLCSAGLPVVYSEILKMSNVSGLSKYAYLLLYNFFFMLDDIIVFVVALKTMKLKGISTKFGTYGHLIGGVIMIIIGILLVFKPEWLMFG